MQIPSHTWRRPRSPPPSHSIHRRRSPSWLPPMCFPVSSAALDSPVRWPIRCHYQRPPTPTGILSGSDGQQRAIPDTGSDGHQRAIPDTGSDDHQRAPSHGHQSRPRMATGIVPAILRSNLLAICRLAVAAEHRHSHARDHGLSAARTPSFGGFCRPHHPALLLNTPIAAHAPTPTRVLSTAPTHCARLFLALARPAHSMPARPARPAVAASPASPSIPGPAGTAGPAAAATSPCFYKEQGAGRRKARSASRCVRTLTVGCEFSLPPAAPLAVPRRQSSRPSPSICASRSACSACLYDSMQCGKTARELLICRAGPCPCLAPCPPLSGPPTRRSAPLSRPQPTAREPAWHSAELTPCPLTAPPAPSGARWGQPLT